MKWYNSSLMVCNFLFKKGIVIIFFSFSAVGQETVMINFDELNRWTSIGDHYKDKSINFPNKVHIIPTEQPHLPGNVAMSYARFEFDYLPIEIEFLKPAKEAKIKVAANPKFHLPDPLVTIQAIDVNEQIIEEKRILINKDWQDLTVIGNRIRRIKFSHKPSLIIDDLEVSFIPNDEFPPQVSLIFPESDTIIKGNQLDIKIKATDDKKITNLKIEIENYTTGEIFDYSICGGNGKPCPDNLRNFEEWITLNLPDSFVNSNNCRFNVKAIAEDQSGNVNSSAHPMRLGKVKGAYDPNKENIKRFINCTREAEEELELAYDFIINHIDEVLDDMNFYRRGGKKIRKKRANKIKRRYLKRAKKLRAIKCNKRSSRMCKKDINGRALGSLAMKARICYSTLKEKRQSLCFLAGVLAHEIAHTAGVPYRRGKKHRASNKKDNVYQIGIKFRDEWCKPNCNDRDLK